MSSSSTISKILPFVYEENVYMTVNDHEQFLQHQLPMSLVGQIWRALIYKCNLVNIFLQKQNISPQNQVITSHLPTEPKRTMDYGTRTFPSWNQGRPGNVSLWNSGGPPNICNSACNQNNPFTAGGLKESSIMSPHTANLLTTHPSLVNQNTFLWNKGRLHNVSP